ncbi:MAG TPA: HRDC domain-containing protein [Candidatus Saccharimonadales bacterium]|nr:HRDC domain-containing protein [Candidatus Saccharimonadales bacterium]
MRQAQALRVMLGGENVFLTGAPGAGKTYVLNQFIKRATRAGKTVAVTASTGIAATHIGGTTIHSWSGLGIRDQLTDWDKAMLAQTPRLAKRYNATDVLVIDEISMLHGKRLDMVNEAAKILRGNNEPFGGMQVILVGDLFQLPPVNRASELVDFAHTSAAWAELDLRICYITEQHRVAGEDGLLDLLEAMRRGELEVEHQEMLQKRIGATPPAHVAITRLYSHNVDVDTINNRHLQQLATETHTYHMKTKGNKPRVEGLVKSLLAPEELVLKVGAEVMFVANDFTAGFVNGSRGRVLKFEDNLPLVKLYTGKIIKVEPYTWSVAEDGKVKAEAVQLPLRLAWAITIHKSQGMSLDAAEIDLSKSFTPGMGYVALSRVRSLNGIYLTGINAMALQLHPAIYEFDSSLLRASAELAEQVEDVEEEAQEPEPDVLHDEALFQKLRQWRLEQARAQSIAPFMVAHDTTLVELATRKPTSIQQLQGVKGFGPKKAETYGLGILDVIAGHTGKEIQKPVAWSRAENEMLKESVKAGDNIDEAAKKLGRTSEEVWQQIRTLL